GNYIPRMLNCIVPRAVLDQIGGRFSTVFDSVAPDFCFAFRCLAVTDEFVYYDRSPLIHHALDRSNGAAYSRGIETPDSADFRADLAGAEPHSAAPNPELHGITNAILHEYCRVREEVGYERFPAVDQALYLEAIARELSLLENHELRRSAEANLISAG